jgi:hypothetical protein
MHTSTLSLVKHSGSTLIRSPTTRFPVVVLNTSCELVHLFISLSQKIISPPFTLCNTCILKTRNASSTKRKRYICIQFKTGLTKPSAALKLVLQFSESCECTVVTVMSESLSSHSLWRSLPPTGTWTPTVRYFCMEDSYVKGGYVYAHTQSVRSKKFHRISTVKACISKQTFPDLFVVAL